MSENASYIATIGFLSLILIAGCQKEPTQYIPYFAISVNYAEGLTTDVFSLSIKPTSQLPPNEKFHARWDWEGDSLYNTRFTNDLETHHRFYKPGNYQVICEVLSLSGGRATDTISIIVQQGYSAPKAKFLVVPETGHFMTDFLFDASVTIDDEDSLETLTFRWDFQDDGIWDTPYSSDPGIYYQFDKENIHRVRLEVWDPSHKSSSTSHQVTVHCIDTCIVPGFIWSSENGRAGEPFIFDASSSYHQTGQEKRLVFKWLFPDQDYTVGTTDPAIEHSFEYFGKKRILLLVEDEDGLQNTIEKELYVLDENIPPKSKILTPTRYGNIETQFYLNAWESKDDRTATSQLVIRWDFDGDGNWDTKKGRDLEIYHQYASPGIYTCILEVEDEEGLSDTTSFEFEVSSYSYPTGFINDRRDGKLYGTVKIGEQWWMSENLDFRIDPKMGRPYVQKCYNNTSENCDLFGSLYLINFVMDWIRNAGAVCPKGWHIPSKSEMNILIDNIEFPNGMNALIPSGSSGFNALFAGFISCDFEYDNGRVSRVKNFMHKDKGFATHFLTTDYQPRGFVYSRVYTLQIQNNYAELYPRKTNLEGFYSIRCVKD